MIGRMGDLPLGLDLLVRRAVAVHPGKEIVTATRRGFERTTYGAWAERTARLAGALDELGATSAGRVASLCWATLEHLELYFGVPCSGRVLHTLNPRFRPEQLSAVAIEAGDEILFVHRSLTPVLAAVLPAAPLVRHVVVIEDGSDGDVVAAPGITVHAYEDLLGAAPASLEVGDERQAAVLCHTGGTTGLPKGVLASHRSLVLHAMAVTAAGGIGIHERDVALPVVPMFHANAVGFCHAAVGTGATLVLPGPDLSGPAIAELIECERVTVTCGVPTIWSAVLPHLAGRPVPALRTIISGASAVPLSLSNAFAEQVGVPLTQIWGMTETSPYGTIAALPSWLDEDDEAEVASFRTTVGPPVLGVEARVVEGGVEVPRDGASSGELQVRGPWVATGYDADRSPESFTDDGWLRTGDVATVDAHGAIRIVDRMKDVIKSGGEWISSIELELHLMAHPSVAEAAVVGVADERWGERPVAYVVPADPTTPVAAEVLADHLRALVPSWWVPDRYVVIDEVPKTSVGKFAKSVLRERSAP